MRRGKKITFIQPKETEAKDLMRKLQERAKTRIMKQVVNLGKRVDK